MYVTQTNTGISVLMTAVVNFAVSNGWTVVVDQVEGTGRRVTLTKIAGMYVTLRSYQNEPSIITGVESGVNTGIAIILSPTNAAGLANANTTWTETTACIIINPTANYTYHLMSTSDGNNITVGIVTYLINNPEYQISMVSGFGTSISKTTNVNEGWYSYGAGVGSNAGAYLNSAVNYNVVNNLSNYQGVALMANNASQYNCFLVSMFSTSSFYGASANMYKLASQSGTNGIMSLNSTSVIGAYRYLYDASASSAFANTALIPTNIFMKHTTVGFNLIGTIPMLWLHNAVPLIYKPGQIVNMNGQDYCMLHGHAVEVHS
jgi:hypothetical protein